MGYILIESLSAWLPEAILSIGSLVIVLLGVFSKKPFMALLATWFVLLFAAAALCCASLAPSTATFYGLITCDRFSIAFRWLALGSLAVVTLLICGSREVKPSLMTEYLSLLVMIGVGFMLMAEASNLLMAYLAMELVSLGSYALVGFTKDKRSSEAALKYLLFGALSSGLMLFGMSLVFGITRELSFSGIFSAASSLPLAQQSALKLAAAFILSGLAFKISMVPFHMWTPDAYEGAPIPVTALLSVGPKAAGFALLVRAMSALYPAWNAIGPILLWLTALTMTLGNVVALVQTNVKRLLAYSTIGQVGYLLIGFVVSTPLSREALIMYLVAYFFMNLGVFACVIAVVNESGSESIEAFKGLAQRSPAIAFSCAVFLLSLAGIPPLLGFFGKFMLLGSAIESGFVWIAILGAINSAAALYYYVTIIRQMYLVSPNVSLGPLRSAFALRAAVAVCLTATLFLGLFPGGLLWLIRPAVSINLI